MSILYSDVVVSIITFAPHWSLPFVNKTWHRAWKEYLVNADPCISRDIATFYGSSLHRAIENIIVGHEYYRAAHVYKERQNEAILKELLPRGINPYLFAQCETCKQELSHWDMRDFALLVGLYPQNLLFHIIVSPVELRSVFDFSRNDCCQILINHYLLCNVCARASIPPEINVYEIPSMPYKVIEQPHVQARN